MESGVVSQNQYLESSSSFQAYLRQNLPPQVVEYLLVCGYDGKKSFLKMDFSNESTDSLKQVQSILCENGDVFGSDPENARKIYGIFHKTPERFMVMPGHRSQVMQFVQDLKRIVSEEERDPNTNPSKERNIANINVPNVSVSKPEVKLYAKPFPSTTYSEQVSEPARQIDPCTTLMDLRKQVQRYLSNSPDPRMSNLSESVHYDFSMEYNSNIFSYETYVMCLICQKRLKVNTRGGRICLSNFFRHVKGCVNKPNKSSVDFCQTPNLVTPELTGYTELPGCSDGFRNGLKLETEIDLTSEQDEQDVSDESLDHSEIISGAIETNPHGIKRGHDVIDRD